MKKQDIIYLLKLAFLFGFGFVAFMLQGCAFRHNVVAATGTVIGVEIAQNPSSQLYTAKLGYNRGEVAIVPTNKRDAGSSGNGAKDSASVLMELRYGNIFSLSEASIYQRLAVGDVAVAQPGAALMFAKSKDGTLDPTVAAAVLNVKAIPASKPDAVNQLLPAAQAFSAATDKSGFESVAREHGYARFGDFLTDASMTVEKAKPVLDALRARSLLK